MVIYLAKEVRFSMSDTDSKVLPAGYHQTLEYSNLVKGHPIISNFKASSDSTETLIKNRKIFIIYYKRQYYGIWREECEVPKIYNGWFNI